MSNATSFHRGFIATGIEAVVNCNAPMRSHQSAFTLPGLENGQMR